MMAEKAFALSILAMPFILQLAVSSALAMAVRKRLTIGPTCRALLAALPLPTVLLISVVVAPILGPGVEDNGPQIMGGLVIMAVALLLTPVLFWIGYRLAIRIFRTYT